MASPTYRFGDYRLDPAGRELWRGGEEVALPRKVFDVILYLFEHRDRAVEHEELFASIWGEVELSERVLPQTILEARRALNDSADEQRFIKTVRGYGYHWVAPVETVHPPAERYAETATAEAGRARRLWPWMLAALLATGTLAGGAFYLWRDHARLGLHDPAAPVAEGEIALLLPVTVEPEGQQAWIRLGVMEHIADRLRAAGQPMVPSDNVIALARGLSHEPTPHELDTLATTTGARLVLAARAEAEDERWRVSLRSLVGSRPPLTARGEAEDVLEAARTAADHLALSLGRTPAPDPDAKPGLALLIQQVSAAVLAEQQDVARALIEAAEPGLRTHPEVRIQLARLDFLRHDLDAAEAALESLLGETLVEQDPVMRSQAVNLLAGVRYARGDAETAERMLKEAVTLLAQQNRLDQVGRVRSNLGLLALIRGEFDAAEAHLARARAPLESTGDVAGLAGLEASFGLLEALRERFTEALAYYQGAADRAATLHTPSSELNARTNALLVHLDLLDPASALALEPRITELLAQADNPSIAAYANVARSRALIAVGQLTAAGQLLADVLSSTESRDDLEAERREALVLRAELLTQEGGFAEAARVATEVVGQIPRDDATRAGSLATAWLMLVRAELASDRLAAARETTAALHAWAELRSTPAPKFYAALAQAELAAKEGRIESARAAFERALALADTGLAPMRVLQVAQVYVPWLLTENPHGPRDLRRATVVANRLARHADHDYAAALLLLQLYHATGPPSVWRAALNRVRSLAGERRIPRELQVAPAVRRTVAER